MTRRMRQWMGGWRPVLAALALVTTVTGCFNPFYPEIAKVRGKSEPAPVPSSATGVVDLFRWCWNNRAYQEYTEIYDANFRFQFSARDTAGETGRGEFLNREAELETARHLFVEGTATEPPAQSISLTLDQTLRDGPDSRQGKNPKWHREIQTDVQLLIKTDNQDFQVTGRATFFVVRGDSVTIPTELTDRFKPDSTRWWIERWEDETMSDAGGSAARGPRICRPCSA